MKFLKPLLVAALAAASFGVAAQQNAAPANWPERPIQMIVPFAAGGPTDIVARMIAIPMGRTLGQTIAIENAGGAGGTIGAAKTARAQPNGYTIMLTHMGMATAPALYKKLTFDPLKDFEYIGQIVDVPMTLLARKDFPPNNLQELLAHLKANGNKISIANAGIGAVSQLCGLLFQSQAGVDLTNVPFSGTGPAMNALLGGQVDMLCDQTTQTAPLIKDNRLKVYGVTVPRRLESLPNVPTLDEQGLRGFEVKVWHGLYAPKGTPQAVVDKFSAALQAAMKDPQVQARLHDLSADIVSPDKMTTAGLRNFLESETAKWGPVIRKSGVQAD